MNRESTSSVDLRHISCMKGLLHTLPPTFFLLHPPTVAHLYIAHYRRTSAHFSFVVALFTSCLTLSLRTNDQQMDGGVKSVGKLAKRAEMDKNKNKKIKEAYHVGEARVIQSGRRGKRRKACMKVLKAAKDGG